MNLRIITKWLDNQIQPLKQKAMNAKEKAQDIINEYWNFSDINKYTAIECAIIHVKGIIEVLEESEYSSSFQRWSYFTKVLNELNKM